MGVDQWEQARRQREFERELTEILEREHVRRGRDRRRTTTMEILKTLIPWAITAAIFFWNSGGSWNATSSNAATAHRRLTELEERLRRDYVTKDDFRHVADDVRDIKVYLLGREKQ